MMSLTIRQPYAWRWSLDASACTLATRALRPNFILHQSRVQAQTIDAKALKPRDFNFLAIPKARSRIYEPPSILPRLLAATKALFSSPDPHRYFIGKKIAENSVPEGFEIAGWHGSQMTEQMWDYWEKGGHLARERELFVGGPDQAASYAMNWNGDHGRVYLIASNGTTETTEDDMSGCNCRIPLGQEKLIVAIHELGEEYQERLKTPVMQKLIDDLTDPFIGPLKRAKAAFKAPTF